MTTEHGSLNKPSPGASGEQSDGQYTCNEYREEMILLALQRKLQQTESPADKQAIQEEILRLEKEMGL